MRPYLNVLCNQHTFCLYRCFDTFLECKVHESDEQTVYKCTECEVRFSALVELTEHETEHKENREEEKGEGKEGCFFSSFTHFERLDILV